MHLLSNADARRPFVANRSGMWLNGHPRGAVVAAPMAVGPGEEAGLRGDAAIQVVLRLRDLA